MEDAFIPESKAASAPSWCRLRVPARARPCFVSFSRSHIPLAFGLAFTLIWWLAPEALLANPCRDPKRTVSGYTVDLQPLLNWWSAPKGPRPLFGWKHVRGSISRDTPSGWLISGKAEGQGHVSTFLLKNPPRDTLRRYHELKKQLAELERKQAAAQEYLRRPVCTDWYSYYFNQWQAPPISLTEYKEAGAILAGISQTFNGVLAELDSMQDDRGNFRLDAFALKVNESFEGHPVFDYGSTVPYRFASIGN